MNRLEFKQKWNYSPECGDGWLRLIDRALGSMKQRNSDFQIRQIKEKFGALRIYTDISNDDEFVWGIKDMAESISTTICEECGDSGRVSYKSGWTRTRCEKHES